MGCFSWMFADTGNKKSLNIGEKGAVLCPDNTLIREDDYEGYGVFNCLDIFDLVADWNREYLSAHPEFLVKQRKEVLNPETLKWEKVQDKRIDEYEWYPAYADLTKSKAEVVGSIGNESGYFKEYRTIGICISCYDYQNSTLPFPIKIVTGDYDYWYSSVPASEYDENQGMGKDWLYDFEDEEEEW